MQSISLFRDHSVDPVFVHPSQTFWFIATEAIKIIAAKIFLEYLSYSFFSQATQKYGANPYEAIVLGPLAEEIFFRFFLLNGIRLIQKILNDFSKKPEEDKSIPLYRFHLHSNIWPSWSSQEEEDEEIFTIPISLPFVEELIYHGVQNAMGCWERYRPHIRIQVISQVFRNAIPQDMDEDTFVIPVCPPVTEEIIAWIYMYIINGFVSDINDEERYQQIFRVHLAAFIFGVAHLSNDHLTKVSAINQFISAYIGGIIYGYLVEKNHSLMPSFIVHGLNNFHATILQSYPEDIQPFIVLAFIVNKACGYFLGMTSSKIIEKREDPLELNEDIA